MGLFGRGSNGTVSGTRGGIKRAWDPTPAPAEPSPPPAPVVETVAPPSRATMAASEPPADPLTPPMYDKRNRDALFSRPKAKKKPLTRIRRWWQ